MWTQAWTTLLRSIGRYATQANCRDLPLRVESRKLAWGLWVLFPSRGSSVQQWWGPSLSSPASSTAHWRWSGICCSAPDSLSLMREGTAIPGRLRGVWSRRLVLGSSVACSGPSADLGLPSMVSRQAFSMQQQETPTPRALGTGTAWGDWGGACGHGEWGGAWARRCGALQVTGILALCSLVLGRQGLSLEGGGGSITATGVFPLLTALPAPQPPISLTWKARKGSLV